MTEIFLKEWDKGREKSVTCQTVYSLIEHKRCLKASHLPDDR